MGSKSARLIKSLEAHYPKGFDLSLRRIEKILDKLGNPQKRLPPIIHIAGTNGKGSTSSFCQRILQEAGYRAHLHTSPHLVNWHERFRIGYKGGSAFVSDDALYNTLKQIAAAVEGKCITIFEILTVAAFLLFNQYPADVIILETGLGGRLDATNVITECATSVITSISFDHEAFLGDTLEKIAFEKAGIIKKGCPVVISKQAFPEVTELLRQAARQQKAPYAIFGEDFSACAQNNRLLFQDNEAVLDLPVPKLLGQHQIINAGTAITAVKSAGFSCPQQAIARAMQNTVWSARMQPIMAGKLRQFLSPQDELWLDGGHNPGAGEVIRQALLQLHRQRPLPLIVIIGMLARKDVGGYLQHFKDLAQEIFCVTIKDSEASLPAQKLKALAQALNLPAKESASVSQALKSIKQQWTSPTRILITGSLYLCGEVLEENGTPPL